MDTKNNDIRGDLKSRIQEIQQEIGKYQAKKAETEKILKDLDEKMVALRTVYAIEAEKHGESRAPLFSGEGVSYRFAGMRLIDALRQIKKENPKIEKRMARDLLLKEGFDFKGKRPLTAVHFAWMVIERKSSGG